MEYKFGSSSFRSSNLVFKHGDARFHVNKAVLCAHSPVLEAALSEDPGITEYVHPKQDEEHTTEGFKLFFECIYDPDDFWEDLKGDEFRLLIPIAHFYEARAVLQMLERRLCMWPWALPASRVNVHRHDDPWSHGVREAIITCVNDDFTLDLRYATRFNSNRCDLEC